MPTRITVDPNIQPRIVKRVSRRPSSKTHVIEGNSDISAKAVELIQLPRQELRILTQNLRDDIFGSSLFVETLKGQLLAYRRLRVMVLVADDRDARNNAREFHELAQRMASQFLFRTPRASKHRVFADEALIADRRAYLHRPDFRIHQAKYSDHDASYAYKEASDFDEMWIRALPASYLRRLKL